MISSASLLLAIALASPLAGREELRVGAAAPEISLPDLEGTVRSLPDEEGPAVILFGELYNENTLAALAEICALAGRQPLADTEARYLLIVGSRDPTKLVARDWERVKSNGRIDDTILVLHDKERKVYESYDVKVLPTLAVVGPDGRLAAFMSGYPLNFADVVTDGVLYAIGVVGRERLQRTLEPETSVAPDETRLRALRTSRMAAALARRKLYDIAIERFQEALALDPTLVEARLGLAGVRFDRGQIQEAQAIYEKVLEEAPKNVAAHIGMARIEIRRDQLEKAEARLKEQVALYPLHPEIHMLLGEAYERGGRREEALGAYKRAARILLERMERF